VTTRETATVKDTDANAVGADVTAEHLADVVRHRRDRCR
jgi:hypothetical protein